MTSVNRDQATIYISFGAAEDHGYMPGTPAARLLQVWELTREAWAFSPSEDAEISLQRHVVVVRRMEA